LFWRWRRVGTVSMGRAGPRRHARPPHARPPHARPGRAAGVGGRVDADSRTS
jgi:hypothetical protein